MSQNINRVNDKFFLKKKECLCFANNAIDILMTSWMSHVLKARIPNGAQSRGNYLSDRL